MITLTKTLDRVAFCLEDLLSRKRLETADAARRLIGNRALIEELSNNQSLATLENPKALQELENRNRDLWNKLRNVTVLSTSLNSQLDTLLSGAKNLVPQIRKYLEDIYNLMPSAMKTSNPWQTQSTSKP